MISRAAGLAAACSGRVRVLASKVNKPRPLSLSRRPQGVTWSQPYDVRIGTRQLSLSQVLRATAGASGGAPQWEIKVLYDGDCPLCMKEVRPSSTDLLHPPSALVHHKTILPVAHRRRTCIALLTTASDVTSHIRFLIRHARLTSCGSATASAGRLRLLTSQRPTTAQPTMPACPSRRPWSASTLSFRRVPRCESSPKHSSSGSAHCS